MTPQASELAWLPLLLCSQRDEVAKLHMQIIARDQLLEQNGIEPPDKTGEEWLAMYRSCVKVMHAAYEAVGILGSSKELLETLT